MIEKGIDYLLDQKLEQAIMLEFFSIYKNAKENESIQKPVSYALYHVWKKWNEKEKPRRTKGEQTNESINL